ncbi:MAG TPA: BrnT family toxin [Burkholderiaceae bacterium]|nr:BrnT family toxin [Burkholderiaceae bacterium]
MLFDWDEGKKRSNIAKHGIDFARAIQIFERPMYVFPDMRFDYGEDRSIGIGWMDACLITVVFVESSEELIRIISARKATRLEEKLYEQYIG